jgi:hypothetical protein
VWVAAYEHKRFAVSHVSMLPSDYVVYSPVRTFVQTFLPPSRFAFSSSLIALPRELWLWSLYWNHHQHATKASGKHPVQVPKTFNSRPNHVVAIIDRATHGVVEKLEQAGIDVIVHEAIEAQSCFPADYNTTIAKTKSYEWLLPVWIACALLPPEPRLNLSLLKQDVSGYHGGQSRHNLQAPPTSSQKQLFPVADVR